MNALSYYSPILLGAVLVLILHDTLGGMVPAEPAGLHWAAYGGLALGGGLVAQLLMIGLQGTFARALPVPVGRTMRGRSALLVGLGILVSFVAVLLYGLFRAQGYDTAATGALWVALGMVAVVMVMYAWSWPTAQRDFA